MSDTAAVVISALQSATGARATPDTLAQLAAGKDLDLRALDLDSLSQFEVIMQIEDAYEIEIDADELSDQETVHGLIAFVQQCRSAG